VRSLSSSVVSPPLELRLGLIVETPPRTIRNEFMQSGCSLATVRERPLSLGIFARPCVLRPEHVPPPPSSAPSPRPASPPEGVRGWRACAHPGCPTRGAPPAAARQPHSLTYLLTYCASGACSQVELRKAAVRLDPNQLCTETADALDASAERQCAAPSDAPLCTYGGTCRRMDGSSTRPLFSWPAGGAACEGREEEQEGSAGDEGHVRAPHAPVDARAVAST